MLLIIGYYLISGAIFYFIIRYLSKKTDKKNIKKSPLIFGYINFFLSGIFLGMYFINPMAFSNNAVINNGFLYLLMAIFSTYFYLIAPGISAGNLAVIYKQRTKKTFSDTHFYFVSILNLSAVLFFGLLTYQIFVLR